MMIRVSDHAAKRASERLGWDAERITSTLDALTMKASAYQALAGIEEFTIKVNGVLFVCVFSEGVVFVKTVVG